MNSYSEKSINKQSQKKVVPKKKPVKKAKKQHLLFYKLVSFILVVLSVVTFGMVIYNDFFDWQMVLAVGIISTALIFIIVKILNKTKLKAWIKNIFVFLSFIIQIIEILIMTYGMTFFNFLSNITDTGYRVESFGLYVLNSSEYTKTEDLKDLYIYYLDPTNSKTMETALAKLQKKVDFIDVKSESLEELIKSLETEDTDAIFMNKTYYDIALEEYPDEVRDLKLIDTIDVIDNVEILKSNADITKEPFTVYISGIDTSGNVASSARSDVNLLLSINPNTNQILMVSTPRDYYVTLPSKKAKDKLTHAGIYGVEESVNALSDLYDVDIDYYTRINFTSFMKIVDAIGGVEVGVPITFCEQNSKRSFEEQDLICLRKGRQTLNGEKALALARHRHTLPTGDKARGSNQMLILEAIIRKCMKIESITKVNNIIKALEGRVVTNMSTDDMYRFAKKQIKKRSDYTFVSLSADGTNARRACYAVGGGNAYVMDPSEDSLNTIKDAFDSLYKGEEINIIENEDN